MTKYESFLDFPLPAPIIIEMVAFPVQVLMPGEYLHCLNSRAWYTRQPRVLRWEIYILAIIALLYFGVFEETEFIYAQF